MREDEEQSGFQADPAREILNAVRVAAAILILISTSSAIRSTTAQTIDAGCSEWYDCRERALAAAEQRDYERFHDLAWRALQKGPPQNASLMYLVARAQALTGRPHDALVMLSRLPDMRVAADALASDDFARTRQLPGWPEVEARIAGVHAAVAPPAPAAAPKVIASAPPAPSPVLPTAAEAWRFTADALVPAGLAYDAVSGRLVIADRVGRKLVVVADASTHATDLVRTDSAGFGEISALEIDARRGDLWVASTDASRATTLHRLQLVSGRPLKSYSVPEPGSAIVADLTTTQDGSLLALDSGNGDVLHLTRGGDALKTALRLSLPDPASLAAGQDESTAYVAHRDGLSRVDLKSRTKATVSAPKDTRLTGIEVIRGYRNSLIAVMRVDAGSREIVELVLNARGTAVTRRTPLQRLSGDGAVHLSIDRDDLVYMRPAGVASSASAADPGVAARELVVYRLRLR
jgi:hypothetical protein